MFIRQRFVTNSSSTGYVVWGLLIEHMPDPDAAYRDLDQKAYVFHVSDTQDLLCIEESMREVDNTSDFRIVAIPNGIYSLSGWHETDTWEVEMRVIAEIPRGNEPKDYSEWSSLLKAFIQKHNIRVRQTPHWMFVRSFE